MIPLAVIAILAGVLTTVVIRLTTDRAALRVVRGRIYAHLLEFRLFFDEPRLIWQAQISLLRDNVRLMRLVLLPLLILTPPMAWLVLQLDAIYGNRPLRRGEPAVVTARLTRPIQATDRFDLTGYAILVETPPIRVFRDNQIVWRIRPSSDVHGTLNLTINGRAIKRSVDGPPSSRSLGEFLLHPEEPRLPDGDLAWIEVQPRDAGYSWMVWFLSLSSVAALLSAG